MRDGSYGVERQNSADSPSGSDTVGSVSSGDRISASTSPENRERKRSGENVYLNPLPDMPILCFPNSAAKKMI